MIVKTLCDTDANKNFDKLSQNAQDEYHRIVREISNLKEAYSIAVDISDPQYSSDYNAIIVFQIQNDKIIIKDTYLFK